MRRLSRFAVLALAAAWAPACAPARAPGPVTPQSAAGPPVPAADLNREQTADQQVSHVLNRLAFGPRPGDAAQVRAMGVDRWIDEQLHPERIDDSRLDQFARSSYQLIAERPADLEKRYPPPGQILNQAAARGLGNAAAAGARREGLSPDDSARLRDSQQALRQLTGEVQSSRVSRAAYSERQLQEVMTDFWLNHFSVYDAKGPRERYLLAEYADRVIRPNAFGKFRTLLGAVAKSEAMLFYLDNWESQADSTRPRLAQLPGRGGRAGGLGGRAGRGGLGRGLPSIMPPQQQLPPQIRRGGLNENYGRELLELHTLGVDGGYTQADVIDAARALTGWTFKGAQQGGGFQFVPFMHDAGEKHVLGHTLKAGRGIEDGEDLLDIVARHPSTAKFIAFKLARRFVSDTPPGALVDRAAATFTRTDGDIREVVRTIVTSPEFFSRAAYRSKVKSPFEVVVSAARALGGQPDATPRTAATIGQLGQPIFGHQAPNGWPETGDQWMNTGAILNRINFGMMVAAGRLPGVSPFGIAGGDSLRGAPLDQQVDGAVRALLGGDVSPETRAVLVSGENPLAKASGSDAPTGGRADPMGAPPAGRGGRAGGAGGRGAPPDPTMGPPDPAMMPPGGGGRGFGQLPQLRGLPLVVGLALGSPEFQRR
ncbi:MAG: DUF1800 domain-containing protein [Gemmatimonadota bacterium]|nr:DUF1800 domain-containing protein [Gemmatimonadota bacterium]